MNRVSDDVFYTAGFDLDKIIALKIENEDCHFLGWMEDAEGYKIQMATHPERYILDRDALMVNEDPYESIINNDEFNSMTCYYILDDDGQPSYEEDKDINEYQKFLSLIENHGEDSDDHDIFVTTKREFANLCDVLKDGEYIFIFEDL